MNVQFLEENKQKKFAIISYRDFVKLVELAADEEDYQKALKILENKDDKVVDYVSQQVLKRSSGDSQRALKKKGVVSASKSKKSILDLSGILYKPGRKPVSLAEIDRSIRKQAAKRFLKSQKKR